MINCIAPACGMVGLQIMLMLYLVPKCIGFAVCIMVCLSFSLEATFTMLLWLGLWLLVLIWCIFASIHKANWSQLTVKGLKIYSQPMPLLFVMLLLLQRLQRLLKRVMFAVIIRFIVSQTNRDFSCCVSRLMFCIACLLLLLSCGVFFHLFLFLFFVH